jgi:hypothetical protein
MFRMAGERLLRGRDSLTLGNRDAIVIKHIRINVGTVGPDNGAQFFVNADFREFDTVLPEWLKDRPSQVWFKIDDLVRAIGETKFHLMTL